MQFYRRAAVAKLLNVPYYTLVYLLDARRIPHPMRDSNGDFLWTEQDVENARVVIEAMREKRAKH